MLGSTVVYTGLVIAFFGAVASVRSKSRRAGLALAASGVALSAIGFLLPARESRVRRAVSQLDRFIPAWQFNEVHAITVAAPPEKVYEAIRHVRADEVSLFRALTWIRRGGKDLQGGILDPGEAESLIDAALKGGFVTLADEPPYELVVGTVIAAPRIREEKPMRDLFLSDLPEGYTIAAMNFAVAPDGKGGSRITTETRVFSSSDDAPQVHPLLAHHLPRQRPHPEDVATGHCTEGGASECGLSGSRRETRGFSSGQAQLREIRRCPAFMRAASPERCVDREG